ncbi:glycerol-3-phosphate dehydrogenase/oxidase [Streptomyces bambusae]|uniref:glycerol-3-phosphate dehydrogenase/oxidase n=1 Tax=Streptomyces bambusae TaxID=1550616 RepID=UPI001CFC8A92|nr:glycerol-3-phosphate dehydrogenase/oxidase [Streptomyces bambusae]MCB5163979.1 glycerol-3-phosphate dehydrogenase/oxidase [Streptomyces bambusae]
MTASDAPSARRPAAPRSALNAARRTADLDVLADGATVDLLVIGGGVTGAGVALDAAARGLRTVLIEAHDLAFGTSRWSSKLVHGGLRYLASAQVGVAHESAVERGILMTRTAPHLIRPLPQVVPLLPSVSRSTQALVHTGFLAGDMLRRAARTPAALLPRARRVDAREAARLVPAVRTEGLRGALVAHDGQLVDDARLVVAIARTAAEYGARVLTRARASNVTGTGADVTDTLTGQTLHIGARAVVNAAGVWADQLDDSIRLRPSRGSHLVFDSADFGHPKGALTVPVPGSTSRFVFALPQQLGRVFVGLTDEEAPGPVPDRPVPTDAEVDFLLDTVNTALGRSLTRADVRGAYAGLRPLLDSGDGATADLSRRHAVRESPSGVITVVGGKLTTYRAMSEEAVDTACRLRGLTARPCRTRDLPLVGAPGHPGSRPAGRADAPAPLISRYGGEARALLAAATVADPQRRIADTINITRAEIEFAVTHEGALDADDVLHRRTRIGFVDADADAARAAVEEIVAGH